MKKAMILGITGLALFLWAAPAPVWADPPEKSGSMGMDHGKMKGSSGHGMDKNGGGHGGGMHLFTKDWRSTLSDEQKEKADRMHIDLMKKSAALKATMAMKEAELTGLLMQDRPDMDAIHKKIDEILEVKRRLMIGKNDHIVQMRGMLTPEQRLSFDAGLLKMSAHKK